MNSILFTVSMHFHRTSQCIILVIVLNVSLDGITRCLSILRIAAGIIISATEYRFKSLRRFPEAFPCIHPECTRTPVPCLARGRRSRGRRAGCAGTLKCPAAPSAAPRYVTFTAFNNPTSFKLDIFSQCTLQTLAYSFADDLPNHNAGACPYPNTMVDFRLHSLTLSPLTKSLQDASVNRPANRRNMAKPTLERSSAFGLNRTKSLYGRQQRLREQVIAVIGHKQLRGTQISFITFGACLPRKDTKPTEAYGSLVIHSIIKYGFFPRPIQVIYHAPCNQQVKTNKGFSSELLKVKPSIQKS